jgi:multiple sugar transport system permease protein
MRRANLIAKNNLSRCIATIVLYAITAIIIFPIFWMLMTSFKPSAEWVTYPPTWIPQNWTLNNYSSVIFGGNTSQGMFESSMGPYLNTFLISVIATVIGVSIGLLAAFGLSRFRDNKVSSMISFMMPRMFPPIAMIIPMMIFFQFLHLIDTYFGLMIVYVGFTLPYSIFMIKGFMDGLPIELSEAAELDGMSNFKMLFKVWIPNIKNGLMTTTLFLFVLNCQEYIFATTLAGRQIETVTISIAKMFSNQAGTFYGPQAALGMMAAIPTIIFGIIIHKSLAYGFTFGALKR